MDVRCRCGTQFSDGRSICSENYVKRADERMGGVGYERAIISREIFEKTDTKRCIPILRGNPSRKVPNFLGLSKYLDFNDDAAFEERFEELFRAIHGLARLSKPGTSEFSGTALNAPKARVVGVTGIIRSGLSVLEDPWFIRHNETASQ